VPTLLLSSHDDPFLPSDVLSEVAAVASRNPWIEMEFTDRGGHVGFIDGRFPWRPRYYAEWRVMDHLAKALDPRLEDAARISQAEIDTPASS
jgi:predicted alpha/beta-fold hydrolase